VPRTGRELRHFERYERRLVAAKSAYEKLMEEFGWLKERCPDRFTSQPPEFPAKTVKMVDEATSVCQIQQTDMKMSDFCDIPTIFPVKIGYNPATFYEPRLVSILYSIFEGF